MGECCRSRVSAVIWRRNRGKREKCLHISLFGMESAVLAVVGNGGTHGYAKPHVEFLGSQQKRHSMPTVSLQPSAIAHNRRSSAPRKSTLRTLLAIGVAFTFCSLSGGLATAAIIAQDSASDVAYTSGQSFIGLDGGTGFAAWSLEGGSTGTNTIAAGPVFSVTESGGTQIEATRPFDAALGVGETFSVLMASTNANATSEAAILLFAGSFQQAVLYYDPSGWGFNDGTGGTTTNETGTSNLLFSFTRTGATSYSMSFGGHSRTGNISGGGNPTAAITEVGFRAQNGATLEFNNLQVVPEPSTCAMLFAGGMSAVGAAVRRRRRQAVSAL